jgi:membrane protease subunit HflK
LIIEERLMPWNEPGGNGNQQDPWTGKKRGSDNGADELMKKLNQSLGKLLKSGGGGSGNNNNPDANKNLILVGIAALATIWLFTGFYMVDARQQTLVMRFGAYQETTNAGLHWHWPYPIETTEVIDVEQNRTTQDRSTMLTKDENIVDIVVSVQYKVNDAEAYAFNISNVDSNDATGTLYQVMRGATREVVGRNDMDFILREGREQIAVDIQGLMQKVLDSYKSGLKVIKVNLTYAEAPDKVKDAFDDANRAREDANRFKNEAETYAKRVVPEASGKAARLLEEATATKQAAIAKAEGEGARFLQLNTEYHKAPEVTRERLYMETMESVLGNSRKVIVDTSASNNMLYLPLDQMINSKAVTPTTETSNAVVHVNSTSAAPATPEANPAANAEARAPADMPPPANTSTRPGRGDVTNVREGR